MHQNIRRYVLACSVTIVLIHLRGWVELLTKSERFLIAAGITRWDYVKPYLLNSLLPILVAVTVFFYVLRKAPRTTRPLVETIVTTVRAIKLPSILAFGGPLAFCLISIWLLLPGLAFLIPTILGILLMPIGLGALATIIFLVRFAIGWVKREPASHAQLERMATFGLKATYYATAALMAFGVIVVPFMLDLGTWQLTAKGLALLAAAAAFFGFLLSASATMEWTMTGEPR